MNSFTDYPEHDATSLGQLVASRDVAPRELVEAAIERIERLNPTLNAVIYEDFDRALERADDPVSTESPFPGVPFLLKDVYADLAGTPTTAGSRSLRNYVPDQNAEIVNRYQAAGLNVLGKTNLSEFGLAPIAEPDLFGPTRNPWDPDLSSGGSSGGSAAAVAARCVPLAHAADGGGSIRIPASACGLFGLKPTRGRTPHGPGLAESWFGLSEQHVVSVSVRDSARALDATQGPDPGAPYVAPPPDRPFADEVGADPGRLRIAYTTGALLGPDIEDECQHAVDGAAKLCDELGHEVVEDSPDIDSDELRQAFVTIGANVAGFEAAYAEELRGTPLEKDELELVQEILVKVAEKTPATELGWALHVAKQSARTLAEFLDNYDLLLTSTLAQTPWPVGALEPAASETMIMKTIRAVPAKPLLDKLLDQLSEELLKPIPNTPLFNMSGQPAMSVPLHWTERGLPVGVQFAAGSGEEGLLFRLAAQLEEAKPWRDRKPTLVESAS